MTKVPIDGDLPGAVPVEMTTKNNRHESHCMESIQ